MVPDLDDEVYICTCLHLSEIWQSLLFAILLVCEASAIISPIPILSRLFCTSFLFFYIYEYQARETESLGRQRGWDAVFKEGLCTPACWQPNYSCFGLSASSLLQSLVFDKKWPRFRVWLQKFLPWSKGDLVFVFGYRSFNLCAHVNLCLVDVIE